MVINYNLGLSAACQQMSAATYMEVPSHLIRYLGPVFQKLLA